MDCKNDTKWDDEVKTCVPLSPGETCGETKLFAASEYTYNLHILNSSNIRFPLSKYLFRQRKSYIAAIK